MNTKCVLSFCGDDSEFDEGALCVRHSDEYVSKDEFSTIDEYIAFKEDKTIDPTPRITPKQNEGKRRFSLVRWEFTRAIAEVMTWGLTKYPAENYLLMNSQTLYDSMMRHLDAHLQGEKTDEESGKPHIWHFASNAMMWFMLEYRKDK